jgi:hypothetical protein
MISPFPSLLYRSQNDESDNQVPREGPPGAKEARAVFICYRAAQVQFMRSVRRLLERQTHSFPVGSLIVPSQQGLAQRIW